MIEETAGKEASGREGLVGRPTTDGRLVLSLAGKLDATDSITESNEETAGLVAAGPLVGRFVTMLLIADTNDETCVTGGVGSLEITDAIAEAIDETADEDTAGKVGDPETDIADRVGSPDKEPTDRVEDPSADSDPASPVDKRVETEAVGRIDTAGTEMATLVDRPEMISSMLEATEDTCVEDAEGTVLGRLETTELIADTRDEIWET